LDVAGVQFQNAKKRVDELLSQVGIESQKDKFPVQLSGGELQRAAIARALVLAPDILLADEPTGNLDPKTSNDIIKLLMEINEKGTTVVMATHNAEIVNAAGKRVVTLEKGKVIKDEKKGKYGVS
jgi:cell division transport system ATP-binding protein